MGRSSFTGISFHLNDYFSNEVSGMTKKAYPNLQKLATIMCCARETMELLSIGQKVEFLVRTADVKAAWEVIQQSMKTFTSFKVLTLVFVNLLKRLIVSRLLLALSWG